MRRRVLFLTVMPSPYQRDLFQALHFDRRMEIRVLYCAPGAFDRSWSIPTLCAYEEILPGSTINSLGPSAHFNPSILGILRKETSDLFVLGDYSAPTTQMAMRYLTWRGKPWIFWGEVPGLHKRGRLASFVRHQLQRPISDGAAGIAAIGSEAVAVYQKLFPQILVSNIPYFCDLAQFKSAAVERSKQRKHTIDVLFSGQLIARKGVDVLIQAFARISHQLPELRLKILGTGPALGALMELIPFDLRDRVQFLGFHQPAAIPKIFAAADIFVLPSRHDGWGVVVNEALGAGLPIIVSDGAGARDLVENGCNGYITRAGDVDSLATALLNLGRSAELRSSFGRSSAERALHFDLDEGVKRWNELYDRVMAAQRQ